MRGFFASCGLLWAIIGVMNVAMTDVTTPDVLAVVTAFNVVFFVIPGFILAAVAWPRNSKRPRA